MVSSDEEDRRTAKTATDVQRLKLQKLLKNISKPAPIPNPRKEHKPAPPPEFVRNVVGSSAGAGSAEYHIYRNVRKKENARLAFIEQQAKKEKLDQEFAERVESKKRALDEKASKKRAKRQRRKEKERSKNKKQKAAEKSDSSSEDSDTEETSQDIRSADTKDDHVHE